MSGVGFAADVGCEVLAFGVDGFDGLLETAGGGMLADVVKHHDGAEHEGGGVGESFAGYVWGGAVDALEDAPGMTLFDIGAIAAFSAFALGWCLMAISLGRTH